MNWPLEVFDIVTLVIFLTTISDLRQYRNELAQQVARCWLWIAGEVVVVGAALFFQQHEPYYTIIACSGRMMEWVGILRFKTWLTRVNGKGK